MNKQTYTVSSEMKFSPLNLMQDPEDNLFDNNSEYEDWECNYGHVNHVRSESVFDNSS